MLAAAGAYIASISVTIHTCNLTRDDWTTIRDYLSAYHFSVIVAIVALTYVTNALVFFGFNVEKLEKLCGEKYGFQFMVSMYKRLQIFSSNWQKSNNKFSYQIRHM